MADRKTLPIDMTTFDRQVCSTGDSINNEANKSKAIKGSTFNKKIKAKLENLKADGYIVDNTTTVCFDRIKQKQWDAYGIKEYFLKQKKRMWYYVVLPNSNNYFSKIDDIVQEDELIHIIQGK